MDGKTNEQGKRPNRLERIYGQLEELTRRVTAAEIADKTHPAGFEAAAVGGPLGVTANNACVDLNVLVKGNRAVKVLGRPVYFFAREALEQNLGLPLAQNIFENYAAFREAVCVSRRAPNPPPRRPLVGGGEGFGDLVGSSESLREYVDQARAAILYPPNGLHCLITGATGTGKSHFAEAMYKFAVERGVLANDAAFVVYNCANYFENPQLLLSQLFGYRKGAFTGADRDTSGVVDQANGGILFLDEAHRLSPEGQEKMFLLIDKGIYQRLGETQEYRRARLRIIAATTEEPKSILLHTFLRRIPVLIQLPTLEERGVTERVTFILSFLWGEADSMGLPLQVHREVIRALTMYQCPGNVGQLQSDVKLLCASAYLSRAMGSGETGAVRMELEHLPKRVQEGLFKAGPGSERVFSRFPFYEDEYIMVEHTTAKCDDFLVSCGLTAPKKT